MFKHNFPLYLKGHELEINSLTFWRIYIYIYNLFLAKSAIGRLMSHLCLSIHYDTSASRWLDLCQLILTANRDFDLFPINLALVSKCKAGEAQPCPKVSLLITSHCFWHILYLLFNACKAWSVKTRRTGFTKGITCCTVVSQSSGSKRVCQKNVFPTQIFPTRQAAISVLPNPTKPACTHKKAVHILNYWAHFYSRCSATRPQFLQLARFFW